ncbi:Vomp family autotransporter [Bartonella sp. B1098]|uniref:Vomp family autotransporter n=1 Tax=Bartonella sp. B1098 TaxID=2911421 RepID=UPI0020C26BED|nr:Vomp family autotransporter [Bartonella sp. B1098]
MKKKYSTPNLIKAVSLSAAMATLLSSVSPVFAAGTGITGGAFFNSSGIDVPYSRGSHGSIVFAGDDDYCGVNNVIGRGGIQQQGIPDNQKITAEKQYKNFIYNQVDNKNRTPYGTTTQKVTWQGEGLLSDNASYMGNMTTGGIANAMPEAYGVYSFVTGCGAAATGNYSTAFGAGATAKTGGSQAFGVAALASGKATVAIGIGSEASSESAVAFGGLATASGKESIALGVRTKASGQYAVAIGTRAEALASGAIAIGGSEPVEKDGQERYVTASAKDAIAIGSFAHVAMEYSVAIGSNAQVIVKDGVAIGGGSVSRTDKGAKGYDPATGQATEKNNMVWVSTAGAFSVGEVGGDDNGMLTRQITGVAAGTEDTDAVNVAQLKAISAAASGTWELSVNDNDKDVRDVNPGNTIDFSVKSEKEERKDNLKIEKSNEGNKHKIEFILNDNLNLTSVTTGRSSMSDDGFIFQNGAKITIDGIEAGDKKITNVLEGTDDTDAVNVSQLHKIRDQIAGNSLVKWAENKKLITIGKEKGGTKIDIANESGDSRTISGVKDGKLYRGSTEAVNGSQLWGTNQEVSHINTKVTTISGTVTDISKEIVNLSEDAVRYDRDENGQKTNKITLKGSDKNASVSITNVADGLIKSDSKDTINGSQINKISGNVAKFFGGDAAFENGAFSGPTYVLSNVSANGDVVRKEYKDVGSALTELDVNVKNVNNHIKYVDKKFDDKFDKFSQDALLWSEVKQAFVALHKIDGRKTDSKIQFLADGDISEESTDAINGSQIHSMGSDIANYFGGNTSFENGVFKRPRYNLTTIDSNGKVKQKEYNDVGSALSGLDINIRNVNHHFINAMNDIANYFGGGAGYDKNGEWHAPTFQVYQIDANGTSSKKNYSNVADAFKGVNNTFTNIHNQISDIKENSLVKQEEENGLITIGKATGGTKISIENMNGEDRTLSGVKEAELSQASKEAVNGSQVFKIAENTSKYFGGSTDVLNGIKPAFLIQGEAYHNVFDAFNGVNVSINKIDNKISDLEKNSLVKWDEGQQLITIGKDKAGTEINIAGYGNAPRKISGVREAEKDDEAVNKAQLDKSIKGISKDALLWDDEEEAFVARHEKDGEKTKSKLKYLLDGNISKDSTDAINGSQLYSISNQLANYFGGGAKYENGKWTAPTFKIVQVDVNGKTIENSYNTVAEAFGGINSGMSNINNRIDDVINKVDSDALKWSKDKKAYDAGRDGKPNKIINVADGKIEKGSKDAVNGGQLWQTNERVAKVENRVTDVENHVEIIDKKVDNISNTIADIGEIVTNIDVKVGNIDNKVNDIAKDAVRYDRDENGNKTNKITLAGGDTSEPVLIDNVADGKIEKGSKEAINGGQLHDYTQEQMKIILDESKQYTDQKINNIRIDAIDDAVDKSKQYTDMKFEVLNYSIESVRKEARQAAAIGLAVSNLRYNDTPGKLSVGFGTGLWRSQSAFAFGAGYTSEKGDIRSNVSVTTSGGHWGVGAGFNMTLN